MVKLDGIYLQFNGKQVFSGFDFYARAGEKVLLSAPSGTGKTCFFNIILGYLRPDAGCVTIGGSELSGYTVQEIRRRVCYIGQEAILPLGQVKDVIAGIGGYRANKGKDFSEARIKKLLEAFSLEEGVLEKNVEALSGGERQRLLFVICLLLDRDIWLLDEITAGLDAERKSMVMESVAACNKTVIIASHDPMWREYGLREAVWQKAR